jgi:hypothetical protein
MNAEEFARYEYAAFDRLNPHLRRALNYAPCGTCAWLLEEAINRGWVTEGAAIKALSQATARQIEAFYRPISQRYYALRT